MPTLAAGMTCRWTLRAADASGTSRSSRCAKRSTRRARGRPPRFASASPTAKHWSIVQRARHRCPSDAGRRGAAQPRARHAARRARTRTPAVLASIVSLLGQPAEHRDGSLRTRGGWCPAPALLRCSALRLSSRGTAAIAGRRKNSAADGRPARCGSADLHGGCCVNVVSSGVPAGTSELSADARGAAGRVLRRRPALWCAARASRGYGWR